VANFYTTLPAEEIAQQVADLLNKYNKLRVHHSGYSIMNSSADYFAEIYGDRVVGCSAIIRETEEVTKQFHLCVAPEFRRLGVARKLKRRSMSYVKTPYVYVTIREDNPASIALNDSEGFLLIKETRFRNHNVLLLAKDLRNTHQMEVTNGYQR
jgi:ribosomal protein S18 acetylase RimI-like enzyme